MEKNLQVAFGSPEVSASIVKERSFLSSVVLMLNDVTNRTPTVPLETAGFALTLIYNCALVGGELVALPIVSEEGMLTALLSFSAIGQDFSSVER